MILDFLVPATVLGMVGPVVAKMAVEQSKRTGSAIGDVYFCGAIGSIVGTFLAGFILMYRGPDLDDRPGGRRGPRGAGRAALSGNAVGLVLGLLTAAAPGPGLDQPAGPVARASGASTSARTRSTTSPWRGTSPPSCSAGVSIASFRSARRENQALEAAAGESAGSADASGLRPSLSDLAVLAFLASLAFMALEMVAGRLVTRHLGSSIYGWTSVIGVLLAGLSLGNYLGGTGRPT